MGYVPLSDDETRVVFTDESARNVASLDAGEQKQVLRKLITIAGHDAPPSRLRYEHIANLDVYAVGDLTTVEAVERPFEREDALTADDLRDPLPDE